MLSAAQARAIWKLVNECRELGDDRVAWRAHCLNEVGRLVDSDLGVLGEMGGCQELKLRDMGVTFSWRSDFPGTSALDPMVAKFRTDPNLSPAMMAYHEENRSVGGKCLSHKELIEDRDWYRSVDYQYIQEPFGMDAIMWCFRRLGAGLADESCGLVLVRQKGRRSFNPRDRTLVRELNAMLAGLVGGPLARYRDPSPSELPRRTRQVLACLLEGDSDKQIAARLRIASSTVNEYTKAIYRFFGVNARTELMARWIRRGWGSSTRWTEYEDERPMSAAVTSGRVATFELSPSRQK